MNLIEMKSQGASIAKIKYAIKNNLTIHMRYCRCGDLSNYIAHRNKCVGLGNQIAQAIEANDANKALEVINAFGVGIALADQLFENVFSANVSWCDHCRKLVYDEDCSSVDGDGSYCQRCLDNHYHWSDREDRYVSDQYSDDYDDDSSDGAIGGYHSSKRRLSKIPSSFDSRKPAVYLGMELEIEIREGDREERAEYLLDNLSLHKVSNDQKYLYALCENDGSLFSARNHPKKS